MKALLVVAHGSRRPASNDEVRALTHRIRAKAKGRYAMVACAFLELAEPLIPDGIESCIQRGMQEIIVLPYFLSAGRHVAKDIPELVHAKQAEHPDLTIRLARHLGASHGIEDLMLSAV